MVISIAAIVFALIYTLGTEATNYISVYGLGMMDQKFGDAQGNLEISHQLVPVIVGLATASFITGIGYNRVWLRKHARAAVLTGAVTGLCCSAAMLGNIVLGQALLASVAAVLVPINLFVVGVLPAVLGHYVSVGLGARPTPGRSAG